MSFEVPNLTLLKHFVVVAEERGISKAAKRLRISQPALSKNLRRLETLLGTQLFERHSGGSDLTETGAAFFDRAQVIGLEYEHAVQEIRNLLAEQAATIKIGAGPVWTSTIVPSAMPRFHARFPRHRLVIQTGSVDQMIEDLRLGRIDIFAGALIQQNQMPGFVRARLARAELGIMCAENHPLARIDGPISAHQLAEYPFISFVASHEVLNTLSTFLKQRGAPPPREMIETTSIYASVELTRSGNYLFFESTTIASSRVGAGLKVLNFEKPIHEFDMGLVYRENLDRLAPYRAVMKAMVDVLKENIPRERFLSSGGRLESFGFQPT